MHHIEQILESVHTANVGANKVETNKSAAGTNQWSLNKKKKIMCSMLTLHHWVVTEAQVTIQCSTFGV